MATATLHRPQVVDLKPADIVDVSSMLASMGQANTATKKAKSKVPVVAGHEDLADMVANKKRDLKQAETEFAMAEAELAPVARAAYEGMARQGNFTKSLNFAGDTTPGVRVSFTDRFYPVPFDKKNLLLEHLNGQYATLFEERRELALRQTDDETVRFLLETLGQEAFAQLFEVKVEIKAKGDMDREQFDLPEPVRAILAQYKPSVTAL